MNRLSTLCLAMLMACTAVFAQQTKKQKNTVRPLTAAEVSTRLSPEIKLLAFGPVSKLDLSLIHI